MGPHSLHFQPHHRLEGGGAVPFHRLTAYLHGLLEDFLSYFGVARFREAGEAEKEGAAEVEGMGVAVNRPGSRPELRK